MTEELSRFECISPLDYRYCAPELRRFLSEEAFTEYKQVVEIALVEVLSEMKVCSPSVVDRVHEACEQFGASEVYDEEDRIHHDIRALVNLIQGGVGDSVKPYVHMSATSFDISDTANAARYKEAVERILLPGLVKLERTLMDITVREAETVQIGRTHGQHAVPITFGFAMGLYVERLGSCIAAIKEVADNIVGKFSGAVGAYNASALFFDDPENFEAHVLEKMGLYPAGHSSQIVPPESRTRLFNEICLTASVLANLADDMRALQRTEIGEVGEPFEAKQVGSSTMPQKQNPINFENVKSMWKIVEGLQLTLHLDQISEHQRDLTNSASGRTYVEIIGYTYAMIKRMTRVMGKLTVNRENMERNLAQQGEAILSEPLYIILASLGHPDAHEKVRSLNQLANADLVLTMTDTNKYSELPKKSLGQLIHSDPELKEYLSRMTDEQRAILSDPHKYIGIAPDKARSTVARWENTLKDLGY